MRYLMIAVALMLPLMAFAAPVLSDSAAGVVTLTIDKYVDISPDADGASITLTGNGQSGSATLAFPYVTNCAASISAAISASTTTTGAVWGITAGAGPAAVVAPGGTHSVTVGVTNGGVQLLSGADSATVTATITAS